MSTEVFPEKQLDPPEVAPCACTRHALAIAAERVIDKIATECAVDWKGRTGRKITDDLETLLGNYYDFGYCSDCKPEKDGDL